MQIPSSVHAVLAARIDRLPAPQKSLLQTAAVIGQDVPVEWLQSIADLDRESVQELLAELQAAEFLYESRLLPAPEYTFKHALTHRVAYESVLRERRRALHRRLIDIIETRYADRLDEHVERSRITRSARKSGSRPFTISIAPPPRRCSARRTRRRSATWNRGSR